MILFRQADISRPLHESIEIEVRTQPRAHVWLHRGKVSLRLRYRVTRAVTVIGKGGKGYGPFLYGYRVRPDGVVFGQEHRINNTRRIKTLGMPPTEGMFPVPEGTIFKDISGLSMDEVAELVTPLSPKDQATLREILPHLDEINAWLLSVSTSAPPDPSPALTRKQMREQGLICRQPHGCNGWTSADEDI